MGSQVIKGTDDDIRIFTRGSWAKHIGVGLIVSIEVIMSPIEIEIK